MILTKNTLLEIISIIYIAIIALANIVLLLFYF